MSERGAKSPTKEEILRSSERPGGGDEVGWRERERDRRGGVGAGQKKKSAEIFLKYFWKYVRPNMFEIFFEIFSSKYVRNIFRNIFEIFLSKIFLQKSEKITIYLNSM